MTYYVLAARETAEAPYHVAFGDYDRATVKDEMADLAYSFASRGGNRRSNMKIIKAARATKNAVDAALAELNAAIGSRANVAETAGAERGPLATVPVPVTVPVTVPVPVLEAHYTNGGKLRPASVQFAETINGARTWLDVVHVTGKREARAIAKRHNATAWNF